MATVPNLRVNEEALHWDPAEVTAPSVPAMAGGEDPMSQLVSEVMPEVAAKVAQMVADTRAREVEFAANIEAAKRAYRGTDADAEQDLRAAEQQIHSPDVTSGGSTAGSRASSFRAQSSAFGQLLSAPMQIIGAAASMPQGVMHGVQDVGGQVGQLAGSVAENTTGAGETDVIDGGSADTASEQSDLNGETMTRESTSDEELSERHPSRLAGPRT